MSRKNMIVTSVIVLAVLAFSSFGGLVVSAWHVPTGGITTTLSSPSVVAGTGIYDTASVTGVDGSGANLYGTVVFQVFADGGCTGSPLSWGGSKGTSDTITINSPGTSNPGVFKSDTFSTTGLKAGSYSFQATYTSGNYFESGNSANVGPCESFTITTTPPSGVPQFPLGTLGMAALIGMMVPLLFVLRSRFMRNLPVA